MTDPKPCPYCGSRSLFRDIVGSGERIICRDCGAIGPEGDSLFLEGHNPYQEAIAKWNRRIEPARSGKMRVADTKHAPAGLMARAEVEPMGTSRQDYRDIREQA